jgi:short-subunit dehydrogenase
MTTKTTLIIGGASGMGLATAHRRATQGDALWLAGRSAEKLDDAAASLREAGAVSVRTTAADIADPEALARLIAEIDAAPDHVARLVNAAGTFAPKPFLDHDASDFDHYHDMNRGRQHRLDVGQTGGTDDPLLGLLHGQGRATCPDPAPGDGTG